MKLSQAGRHALSAVEHLAARGEGRPVASRLIYLGVVGWLVIRSCNFGQSLRRQMRSPRRPQV
jgi:hypothetical protein